MLNKQNRNSNKLWVNKMYHQQHWPSSGRHQAFQSWRRRHVITTSDRMSVKMSGRSQSFFSSHDIKLNVFFADKPFFWFIALSNTKKKNEVEHILSVQNEQIHWRAWSSAIIIMIRSLKVIWHSLSASTVTWSILSKLPYINLAISSKVAAMSFYSDLENILARSFPWRGQYLTKVII